MANNQFPEWAVILYRGMRAAVAAGLAAAWLVRPDWSKPDESIKVVGVAFLTGASVSFGKWIRDILDEKFGYDEKSLPARIMPL